MDFIVCDSTGDISIHAAREGGDLSISALPPRQRISIHAAREGGDLKNADLRGANLISIHAAREGGDDYLDRVIGVAAISIHAAREGGDQVVFVIHNRAPLFQSTPPVKAATKLVWYQRR